MATIGELTELGQAVWLDYIRRSLIQSGELAAFVTAGLRGVTSNPTIFDKVIAGSADYDGDMQRLVASGISVGEIYEKLVLGDIGLAADVLRPVYVETEGADGFVSVEVSPALAYDTEGTVSEARDLFTRLDRHNIMIKVPATAAGIVAIETLIGYGINVNATLIFSLKQYQAVAEAYIRGLEILLESGGDLRRVASVASFFISRVDTAVDAALDKIGNRDFQGTIAIANAKIAYARFRKTFSGDRWQRLAASRARVQRVLWASTGTKNPACSDIRYIEELIGSDTVNTVPPATLRAFLDHGKASTTLEFSLAEAEQNIEHLNDLGIDLDALLEQLQEDGVAAFEKSHEDLMARIAEKRVNLLSRRQHFTFELGAYREMVDRALTEVRDKAVMARIWAHDHTVWKPEPTEITNRLGWLHSAEVVAENIERLDSFADTVRADGYTHALLLGMGGSSLAPEVFGKTFGARDGSFSLSVLDSTDPGAVLAYAETLDLRKTLFIVSTKSGSTVETSSFFNFFYNRAAAAVGEGRAGEHFVAITDPGSSLAELADRFSFRAVFLNDPTIGGRYSALSYFGMVPAALIGMNLQLLLDRSMIMRCNSEACNCPVAGNNMGAQLGVVLGEMAKIGRDKVTLVCSQEIGSFGDWVEQLIAESTGKEGKGILPVVGEPLGAPDIYRDDRVFVCLALAGDDTHREKLAALEAAGHPVVVMTLRDSYDLGGQYFLWEMATAVAGSRMGINPFDQPNVESAKILARDMVAEYKERGRLPVEEPTLVDGDIAVFVPYPVATSGEALRDFIEKGKTDGAYIAIQAYVTPGAETDRALKALRLVMRDRYKIATTVGYGPRFLHSTGQLHKGDAGAGLFIQITAGHERDVPIPDEAEKADSSVSFGVLKMAQAMGDRQALVNGGRRVIRFHIRNNVAGSIQRLAGTVS